MTEYVRRLEKALDASTRRVDELCRENEKLRELVRDLYPFALGRAAKPWLAIRRDRIRELGVDDD